ncbi:MAG: hypothetical protein WCJ33_09905 [Pseudomonadota bacterium]
MTKEEDGELLEKKFFHHSDISEKITSINQIDEWATSQIERFSAKFSNSDWTTGSNWR